MRINPLTNNVNFGINKKDDTVKKQNQPSFVEKKQPVITPDYKVKTPQKYNKIGTTPLIDDINAQIYKLESGQKVIIIHKEGPTIIKTYVNTGSLNEKDSERGISHFVEHSLFNGSNGLKEGEFFETVNKMGANTNASTSFSATDYYIKSNLLKENDLETQIKIHASMLETPKFTQKMIEKEKGPVTSEISMILDDTENIAINNTIKNLFNIKTTSEDIIGGTIENINNLTREKVVNYYKQNYYPSNMVTVITGDVDEKETIKLISKYMQNKTNPVTKRKFEELNPIDKSVKSDITSNKANNAFISIGFKGPENNNTKDQILFDAVSYVLTNSTLARINNKLESIQSEATLGGERLSSEHNAPTALLLVTDTDESNSDKAISLINEAINSLKTNPPSEKEIEFIKKNLKFDFAKRFEKSSDINAMVGGAMLDGGLSAITEYQKYIDTLKPQDFIDFTTKYLDTNKESITVIHPEKNNKISFGGRKPLPLDNIETKTLSNNALVIENTINKDISFADFKLTSNIKISKPGAKEVLSELLSRGSKEQTKEDFYKFAEENGILLAFSANSNSISASTTFMKNDVKTALNGIKSVILNPRFTEDDFKEAKKQIIQDIKDTPVNAKEGLYAEIFKDNEKGLTKEDLLKGLNELCLDDVKDLYKNIINNSQLRISVSGNFKDDNFRNDVEKELEDFPKFKEAKITKKESYTPVKNSKVVLKNHNKSQAEIITGYKFNIKDNSPEKMVRYSLLNIILGGTASSRLFNDLRESQKLAYHVSSSLDYNDDDTGVCNLYIKTTTDDNKSYKNIEKSIQGFNNHTSKLLNKKVSSEELENAKLVFKNRMFNDNETTGNKNATLLSNLQTKTGLDLTNNIMKIVDNITAEDLQDAAKEIFTNKPVYSIVARQEAIKSNEQFLNNLTL